MPATVETAYLNMSVRGIEAVVAVSLKEGRKARH
jgi:hypothetical protein